MCVCFLTEQNVFGLDHVAVPDFSAGAMENWGLVLYRETALLHDDTQSSIANKYWVSLIMAHEIAHSVSPGFCVSPRLLDFGRDFIRDIFDCSLNQAISGRTDLLRSGDRRHNELSDASLDS